MHLLPTCRPSHRSGQRATCLLLLLSLLIFRPGTVLAEAFKPQLEFARLIAEALQDPDFLGQPDGAGRLEAFLTDLATALAKSPGPIAQKIGWWALHCRHRTTARPLLEKIFQRARDLLVPLLDVSDAGMDGSQKAVSLAVRRIDLFRQASKDNPPPAPAFPLRPDPRDLTAPTPPGASGPVNVVASGLAAIPWLDPDRAQRLAALVGIAFPGNGPTRVEVTARDAEQLDLDLLLHDWTPPFRWFGFGPVTALAAEFRFRGIPRLLFDRIPPAAPCEILCSSRLESFSVVVDAPHLEKVTSEGGTTTRLTATLAWPGQTLKFPVPDAAAALSALESMEDEYGFQILNPQTAESDRFLAMANQGGEPAILVMGTDHRGESFRTAGTIYAGTGQPGFSPAVLLVNGKRPGFPLGMVWQMAPSMVIGRACQQFFSLLAFRPWLEDLSFGVNSGGQKLLVLTGRGIRADEEGDDKEPATAPARPSRIRLPGFR